MKILEAQSATLTNAEVLAHLARLDAAYTSTSPHDYAPRSTARLRNLHAVVTELSSYLTRVSPAALPGADLAAPNTQAANANADADADADAEAEAVKKRTADVMRALAAYKLTKGEVLMLFNLRPKDMITLDIVVEEASSRFTEEEQRAILEILRTGGKVRDGHTPANEGGEVMEGVEAGG